MRTYPALAVELPDENAAEQLQVALVECRVAAVFEQTPRTWQVFFHDPRARDDALTLLSSRLPGLSIQSTDVDDGDWAARSQAGLTAVRVGAVVVAPPWDLPGTSDTPDEVVVVIEPSTGFGTGHHATTRLCLAALQRVALSGCRVLDVGTGSGVLAIAASRLGAGAVLAVDDDQDAIDSAARNLKLNPGVRVELRVADVRTEGIEPVPTVVANLTGPLLVQVAPRLRALATPSGRLILSGYLSSEEAGVLAAFNGCELVERTREQEWACATFRVPASG